MKRFLFFVVFVCSVLGMSAQRVVDINKVAKEGKTFIAYGDSVSTPVTAAEYLSIKKSPTDFFIVEYKGNNGFTTVVDRSQFTNWIYTVDSVGIADEGKIEVFFAGTAKPYTTTKTEWSKVLKGQKVQHLVVNSPKREFELYATVLNRSVGAINQMKTGQKLLAARQRQETVTTVTNATPVQKQAQTSQTTPQKKRAPQGKLIFM